MRESPPYQLYADLVLVVHVGVVLFVVGGLMLFVVGGMRGWRWVRRPWVRVLHLGAVAVVVVDTWFGAICPLTDLEMDLRAKAGAETYSVSFIEYWLQRLLYFDAPFWVFGLVYSLFGVLVITVWWWWPPRWKRSRE